MRLASLAQLPAAPKKIKVFKEQEDQPLWVPSSWSRTQNRTWCWFLFPPTMTSSHAVQTLFPDQSSRCGFDGQNQPCYLTPLPPSLWSGPDLLTF